MTENRQIVFYDCTKNTWRAGINLSKEILEQYPYVFGLLDKSFRGDIIKTKEPYTKWEWGLCEDVLEWLEVNSLDYYYDGHGTNGLLCFADKETVMRFKLTWN